MLYDFRFLKVLENAAHYVVTEGISLVVWGQRGVRDCQRRKRPWGDRCVRYPSCGNNRTGECLCQDLSH